MTLRDQSPDFGESPVCGFIEPAKTKQAVAKTEIGWYRGTRRFP
jgi:hypothetical protein